MIYLSTYRRLPNIGCIALVKEDDSEAKVVIVHLTVACIHAYVEVFFSHRQRKSHWTAKNERVSKLNTFAVEKQRQT
jgi:hypothetical protein